MAEGLIMPLRLSDRVWRLGCYHVPVYLVRGDECSALFEVGITATVPLILAQLASLGVPLEEMRYLVLSHAHSDHATGQSGLMVALPSAHLVLSEGSRRFLSKPTTAGAFEVEDAFVSQEVGRRESLSEFGPSPDATPLLPDRLHVAAPGDHLQVGGAQVHLLAADGHAPGGLLGHLPEEGVVLASDSAGYCTAAAGPAYPMYFVSYRAYQDTLAWLLKLNPSVLGLGHQLCLQGQAIAEYLTRTTQLLADEREAIRRGYANGLDPENLAMELFARYYRDELTMFPPASALRGCRLLVHRSLED